MHIVGTIISAEGGRLPGPTVIYSREAPPDAMTSALRPTGRARTHLLAALACGALLSAPGSARPAPPPRELDAFMARAAATWAARDVAGWTALWELPGAEEREAEAALARASFRERSARASTCRCSAPRSRGRASPTGG